VSRTRQVLVIESGVLVVILAITTHGAVSAVAVGAWLGIALHSAIIASRSAKKLPLTADRRDK